MRKHVLPFLFLTFAFAAGCSSTSPKCENDESCRAGEYCVDGQCQECREDGHCAAGESCNAGRCEPIEGYCTSNDACGPNGRCEKNRCVVDGSADLGASSGPSCNLSPVYFDFDADALDATARSVSSANVTCAKQEASYGIIQLTGHTDPRGTEEYNLALSDRRARAVQRYMVSLGLAEERLRATGMGEEMATGEDESGYGRDRRVDVTPR